HAPMGAPLAANGVEAVEREFRRDLGVLDGIAEEDPRHGLAARGIVAALAVGVLEQHGRLPLAAHHQLGREHLAGLRHGHADLPDVLVDDAELVAGAETRLDVHVPAEDVGDVGGDAGRYAGRHGIVPEPTLDGPGDAFHLDEVRQVFETGGDAVARLLGHQQVPLVHLVANRLEGVRLTVEAQGETLSGSDLGQVEDAGRGLDPLTSLGDADATSGQDVLDRIALTDVDVLVHRATGPGTGVADTMRALGVSLP